MIRVAMIGTGSIAETHIKAFLQFPTRCQMVALMDVYPEKAERTKQAFGLAAKVYTDHRTLLDDCAFDLAVICAPPFVHAPATIDALNAGKHVLVEKPMATSL